MKLLFEGWRRYLNEDRKVLKEGYSDTEEDDNSRDALYGLKSMIAQELEQEGHGWVLDDDYGWGDIEPFEYIRPFNPEGFIKAMNDFIHENTGTSIEELGITGDHIKNIMQSSLQRGGR
tara:strand:+ start:144 stop:500 length:357 start_codon:yes stop_codon:yes gene_type:complete